MTIWFTAGHGYDNAGILNTYCSFTEEFRYISRFDESSDDLKTALLCSNISLGDSYADDFKNNNFNFTTAENVIFAGGNVGVVNSDFFKHFPHTKRFVFNQTSIDLRPSATITVNPKVYIIAIIRCSISQSNNTNALHSLSELKDIRIAGCSFKNTTIDGELLRMNKKLLEITFDDSDSIPGGAVSPIQHIDDSTFDGLDQVQYLFLMVKALSKAPSRWYVNKSLSAASIDANLEEFPSYIPTTTETLDVAAVKHLTRNDFRSLKNLHVLGLGGKLEAIDEDTFDDLEKLTLLSISRSNIQKFSKSLVDKLNIRNVYIARF